MFTEMEDNTQKEGGTQSLLSKVSSVAPGLLILASGLYGLGLYTAYRMDSLLGVGSIEVSRERAVCLGVVLLVVLSPTIVYWAELKEMYAEFSDSNSLTRLKLALVASLVPVVCGVLLFFLLVPLFGVTRTDLLVFSLAFPLFVISFLVVQSGSNARRIVFGWPIFLMVIAPFLTQTFSQWLPSSFGGHIGPEVKIVLQDRSEINGSIASSDSRTVVIKAESSYQAISRDQISRIESNIPAR